MSTYSLMDYITELEGIEDDIQRLIIQLNDNSLLFNELRTLEQAKSYLRQALNSFRRLKGLKR